VKKRGVINAWLNAIWLSVGDNLPFMVPFTAILFVLVTFTSPIPNGVSLVDAQKNEINQIVGNVSVTFTDGHSEKWTNTREAMLPKVDKTGLVGWARYETLYQDLPVFTKVRIVWPDGHYRDFEGGDVFIEAWDFVADGSAVIIKSREAHGSPNVRKYDIETGKVLAEADGHFNQGWPEWARAYADGYVNPVRGSR
jgi:hypothetical protein